MSREAPPRPPVARREPKELSMHGDTRIDDYFWMKDRANPGVIEYIEAENRYASEFMKPTEPLQKRLFDELKGKLQETDSTVPQRNGDYLYYDRTEAGKQYAIFCRKRDSPDAAEEVILDVNEAAEGNVFYKVGHHKVSPDHNMLMYLADSDGSERHTLNIKDLRTGELLAERIPNTSGAEWANDNKTVFYSILDHELRAYKVLRHVLGTDHRSDVEVFHEKDPGFYYMVLSKSKCRGYITITVESATTSEVHYLRADQPRDVFKVVRPRKHRVVYFVLPYQDKFYIVTNEDAVNFKIMEAPAADPSAKNWKELVPHRERVTIDVSDPFPFVEPFRDHLVIFERESAQGRIRVLGLKDGKSHFVGLDENMFMAYPVSNPDPESDKLRIRFFSMVTPTTIYDYDLRTRTLELKKRDEVPGHDPSRYVQELAWTRTKDGALVPLTLVYRKGLKRDGRNPAYMYGYGGYGMFEWASDSFNFKLLPLLDRGFVCAHAHIRGGSEMGRKWHEAGRMLTKMNSFTDFIACAEHLVKEGYTAPDRLVIRGRSAGGLLVGAVTNMRPDLLKAVVAEVPFVDALTTMADATIPLTAGEFEEWGNSNIKEHYDYMKRYSPYDNVVRKPYPSILITSSLNDSRVQYWEPTKWAAKLRALKTDNNVLLLRTGIVEGHAGASGRYDYLKWYAYMFAFVLDRLDMTE